MNDRLERYLTWGLAVVVVVSLIGLVGIALSPPETTDPYTEFYVLDSEGNASGYPTNLSVGGSGQVILGISNHEGERGSYTVVVTRNGSETKRREVLVADGATNQLNMSLRAPREPGRYKLRFLLYKGDVDGEAYRWLRVFVRIQAGNAST